MASPHGTGTQGFVESRGVTMPALSRGRDHRQLVLLMFLTKNLPLLLLHERHRSPAHHRQFKGLETDPGNTEASERDQVQGHALPHLLHSSPGSTGSHTGINHHHMSQLWAVTMPGPSVTSPSALSGAVHSKQHQGLGPALSPVLSLLFSCSVSPSV